MYIPKFNEMTDKEEVREFIRSNSFAILITLAGSKSVATHLPLIADSALDASGFPQRLFGHMAKANEQWKEISGEVLAVFHGPHAYISPTWYGVPSQVPTWNYLAVHVYGKLTLVEQKSELIQILNDSVTFYESSQPKPWRMDSLDDGLRDKLLGAIVGFKIEITRVEAKSKLTQNKSDEIQRRVIDVLKQAGDEPSRQIGALMERNLGQAATITPGMDL